MFQKLTVQQSRNLAIGLLVLVVLLLWLFIAPLFATASSSAEQVDDLRFQLAKYQQAISNKPVLATQQAALKKKVLQAQLFHSDTAPGVVAATVQNTIRQAVEKAQGSLISTQVLPEQKDSLFTRVAISVRLTGSDQVLQELLYELETSRPLLSVEKIVVSSRRRPQRSTPALPPLSITLEVASYLALGKG